MTVLKKLKKKYIKIALKTFFIFAMMCSLFLTQNLYGFASPENNNEKDQLNNVINSIFRKAEPIINTKPKFSETAYNSSFTWSSDQTMHGIFSTSSLYFFIPKYWDTKYALVQINYSTSQLINEKPASVTFSVNDKPFYSCEVKYLNDENQTMYAVIPINLLQEGYNRLDVSGYVRLYDEKGCSDNYSNANWINISKNSEIMLGYEVKPHNNKLSSYPYPFMSTIDSTGSKTSVFISDKGNNSEIAAAMFLSGKLGEETSKENKITITNWNDHNTINSTNSIFIGLTENVPEELKHYFTDYTDELKDNGVILFINDDKGQPMLLISSDKEDGLMDAVRMLNDKDRVDQESSSVAIVKNGSAEIFKNSKEQKDKVQDKYTLEDIINSGLTFIGPFHQAKSIDLPVSNDYILSSAGKVSLKFRYSENLDFNRSLVTVFWGDVPIASKRLSKENSIGDELTFMVPLDVAKIGAKKITITFDLEIQDMECTKRQMDMPWAYVTKDSEFYLPLEESIIQQFDTIPVPFKKNGTYNKILLVLPDDSTKQEFTLASKIVSIYSNGNNPYGDFKVCHANEFLEGLKKNNEYKSMNIITLGTQENNSMIKSLNEQMYFKYNEDGTKFLSNEKLILSENYSSDIGTMQLLKSPYDNKFSILVLTAPTSTSLDYIEKFISDENLRSKLKNDCIIVDNSLEIKSYRFQEKEIEESKPTVVGRIFENKEYALFTLTATSVMLILFLSIVFILIKNKSKDEEEDKKPRNKHYKRK